MVAAVRAQLRAREGDRVGFKAGFGIAAIQELIGDPPVPGHLTTATQLAPGATFDPRGAGALHADCEVVVTVGRDELGVALELVDLAREEGDVETIVTGSVVQVPVAPGDHVVAEIDGLGRAEARIAGATAGGPP